MHSPSGLVILLSVTGAIMNGWRERLRQAVEAAKARGLSKRQISLKAALGEAYVSQLLKYEKDPSVENLSRICEVLGVSLSEILLGFRLDAEAERMLEAWSNRSKEDREAFLRILGASPARKLLAPPSDQAASKAKTPKKS